MTREEYLHLIPDEKVRDEALFNAIVGHGSESLGVIEESFSNALIHAFSWAKSPQGSDYWRNLHQYAVEMGI